MRGSAGHAGPSQHAWLVKAMANLTLDGTAPREDFTQVLALSEGVFEASPYLLADTPSGIKRQRLPQPLTQVNPNQGSGDCADPKPAAGQS